MTTSERRAILAGHGAFAEGAISAVAQIAGLGDTFVPVSNTGLTIEAPGSSSPTSPPAAARSRRDASRAATRR
jgi:hypothetical protein